MASTPVITLIDPSYEIKTDYQTVVQSVKAAHKKFNTGVYLIRYPVIKRKQVDRFEQEFIDSGMAIVSPPWVLAESLKLTLPYLQKVLADGKGDWRIRQLVAE